MPKYSLENYDSVDSRIEKFYNDHPNGAILTKLMSDPNCIDSAVFQAAIYFEAGGHIRATGYAHEERGKSFSDGANFTSWTENSETSAIGRALANAGYKSKKDAPRPSMSEMEKVQRFTDQNRVEPRKSTATRVQEHMQETGQENAVYPETLIWKGPGQCMRCHAPEGKRHGRQCIEAGVETA